MNEWRYNVNCMLAKDLPLEKLGTETLPWDPTTHKHPWNLQIYPSPTAVEKYWNLAKLCVFTLAFHTTTAAAATSHVKDGKIHGSWTQLPWQQTLTRHTQLRNTHRLEQGHVFQPHWAFPAANHGPGLGTLRTDNGMTYRGRCNQNKASKNTVWDLILFILSKPRYWGKPIVYRKTCSISVEHSWFLAPDSQSALPSLLGCLQFMDKRQGKAVKKPMSLLWVWESTCK